MMTASKSKVLSILGKKAIQLVCSSNHDSEFVPLKDILLPSTRYVYSIYTIFNGFFQ